MSVLLIAEHNNKELKSFTLNEMLLQQLKVLMLKSVLLLDQHLLNHVKALVVQHQLKLLKQERNFC